MSDEDKITVKSDTFAVASLSEFSEVRGKVSTVFL